MKRYYACFLARGGKTSSLFTILESRKVLVEEGEKNTGDSRSDAATPANTIVEYNKLVDCCCFADIG